MVRTRNAYDRSHAALSEIRKLLIAQAKKEKPMTYLQLTGRVRSLNLIPNSRQLRDLLMSISMNEHAAGRPLLSAVVVRKHRPHRGLPGKGFFTKLPPLSGCKKIDWPKCWQREVEKVYRYWKHHGAGTN
jgi:hypothetical protein